MDKKILKDASFLLESEMEAVKGGAMSGCSSCCDKCNGGNNQQTGEEDEEQDPPKC